MKKAQNVALVGVMSALAMGLSYLESLLPLDFVAPGIRLGLANLAVVTVLYRIGGRSALAVNLIRILLSAILFTNPYTLAYALSGGLFSLCVMTLLKKTGKFSLIGVSAAGGVTHNLAQTAVAVLMLRSPAPMTYLPILILTGVLTGFLIGAVSNLALSALERKKH
ncbi:MAG: Gx transporter family protein [Eubacteriales bacterium]